MFRHAGFDKESLEKQMTVIPFIIHEKWLDIGHLMNLEAKELVAALPKILGVIAARAGSKRLPGKNLKQIGGRSLIEWSVRAAQNASSIDKLIVSSDCSAIIAEANRLSVDTPFVRRRHCRVTAHQVLVLLSTRYLPNLVMTGCCFCSRLHHFEAQMT